MENNIQAYQAEMMDVLLAVRHHRNGTLDATFMDGAGGKVTVHLSSQAARDLRDELLELGDDAA